MEQFGEIWNNMELFGALRSHLSHFKQFGAILSFLEPFVYIWIHLELYRGIENHLEPFGAL